MRRGRVAGVGRRVPPSLYPPSPGAPEALAWQEAAVSFEASKLGRPLLGGEGAANKIFRGIVGSVGAPKPWWGSRGSMDSPEQAPWHDVVV